MADNLTEEQRSKTMRRIKSKDTAIELKLRKELWHKGYRYRKNYKKLPGKPDIAITKYKIAIFCDSEFFHGANWVDQKEKIARGANADYWIAKIERNMKRDDVVNKELFAMGWKVLRFWGHDIMKNTKECVQTVDEVVFDQKTGYDFFYDN